jgi:hypothetical protein
MAETPGFTTMAGPKAEGEAPVVGVGMLGYAFMGKAHSNAFKTIPYMMYPPPAIPRWWRLPGATKRRGTRPPGATAMNATTPTGAPWWTTRRAAFRQRRPQRRARRTVDCRRAGGQAHPLREAAGPHRRGVEDHVGRREKAGVKHMVAFNYRFVPAIRQIRYLIESGALGRIYHFRAVYLQEWIMPHYNMPMIWRCRRMWPAAAPWAIWAHTSSTWPTTWWARSTASAR